MFVGNIVWQQRLRSGCALLSHVSSAYPQRSPPPRKVRTSSECQESRCPQDALEYGWMALEQYPAAVCFVSETLQPMPLPQRRASLRRWRPAWTTATQERMREFSGKLLVTARKDKCWEDEEDALSSPPAPLSSPRATKPFPPLPPAQQALVGLGRGRGEVETVAELQASVQELLRTQGLGSGTWPESGLPAAVEREQRTLAREVKAMGRKGRWADALEVVERARFQGTELNSIIYGCAISAVGRCGRWKEALQLLDQMKEDDIEPDEYAYSAAIAACSGANKWKLALQLFRTLQNGVERPIPGRERAMGERTRDPRDHVLSNSNRGRDAAPPVDVGKVLPGTATYNAAITACARGLQAEEAMSLLREMETRGVRRDEITYNTAMDACGRGGYWQRALELLSEMPEIGLTPSIVSYNMALDACARSGRWEEAADLIDMMRGDWLEALWSPTLGSTTLGLCEHQSPSSLGSSLIAPRSSQSGHASTLTKPTRTPLPDTWSYNSCIAACRRGGQWGLARLLFEEMMSRGLRPDGATLKSMLLDRASVDEAVRVQSRRQRWREALSLLDDIDGEGLGPDPSCISVALSECANGGRWEECRHLLQDLASATSADDPRRPSLSRYNFVLSALRNAPLGVRNSQERQNTDQLVVDEKGESVIRREGSYMFDHIGREDATRSANTACFMSGALGWTGGYVAAILADMQAAGVSPDNDTYRLAVRCATDAAILEEKVTSRGAIVVEDAGLGKAAAGIRPSGATGYIGKTSTVS